MILCGHHAFWCPLSNGDKMNKFQTMIIAFYSLVASHLPRPGGRLVAKISATITFLFVSLGSMTSISDLDISSLDLGSAAILAVMLSTCLLLTYRYIDTHLNPDGSLKEKKDDSK